MCDRRSFIIGFLCFINCRIALQTGDIAEPCSFYDTVNITGAIQFENGTYSHQGMLVPSELVATYDFVPQFHSENLTRVTSHLRGCVCGLRSCINFCCEWRHKYNYTTHRCDRTDEAFKWPAKVLKVGPGGSNEREVNIFDEFAVQYYRPCRSMSLLRPRVDVRDEWHLLENGSIWAPNFKEQVTLLNKNQYCFVPYKSPTENLFEIALAYCNEEGHGELTTVKRIYTYGLLLSIPCMLVTILVYLTIPQLRNLQGKSLVCYLIGLVIGYTVLVTHTLIANLNLDSLSCKLMGYTGYFFFMSAFFWLVVISLNIWLSVCPERRQPFKGRFLLYFLFIYGLSALCTLLTWLAQEVFDLPLNLKPGIGGGQFCWLDLRDWQAMIYLFGPMLITIVINTIFFVLTALRIRRVDRNLARAKANDNSREKLNTDKTKFWLFLRLFLIMGITWSMEILAYLFGKSSKWSLLFYATDFVNTLQGVLIFIFFVLHKNVRKMLRNKCCWKNRNNASEYSLSSCVDASNFRQNIKVY